MLRYSKEGYFTDTLQVSLINGETTVQNVSLLPKESFTKNVMIV